MTKMSNPQENLKMLFAKMEDFVSTKTVVGEPIVMGETTIVPLVDVSVGMATGVSASKEDEAKKGKDGGAGGMGAKMTPSAVLVVTNGNAQLISLKNQESTNKLIDMIPGVLDRLGLLEKFGLKKDKAEDEAEPIQIVVE